MLPGTWPTVAARTATITLTEGGETREIEAVRLTSDMTGGLPGSGGGLGVTDGDITRAHPELAGTRAPHPFDRPGTPTDALPPVIKPGTAHALNVEDGDGQSWTIHTGVVDSATGDITTGQVATKTVAPIDRLNRPITREPLAWKMPPAESSLRIRYPNCGADFLHDSIARECGWYATPKGDDARTILSATMMGSCWPEVGDLRGCAHYGDPDAPPQSLPAPWGVCMQGVDATYRLERATAYPVLTVCFPLANIGAQVKYILSKPDGPMEVGLDRTSSDQITVNVTIGNLTWQVASVPRDNAQRAALHIHGAEGEPVRWRLRLSDGREFDNGNGSSSMVTPTGWGAYNLQVWGPGSTGAVVVEQGPGPDAWATMNTPITSVMRVNLPQRWYCQPYIEAQNGLAMITDRAAKECADCWIDSQGRLRWVSRAVLDGDAIKTTKSTALSVDNLTWSDDLDALRRTVTLKWRYPVVSVASKRSLILFEGSGDDLSPGDQTETWVTAPPDETWLNAIGPLSEVVRFPNLLRPEDGPRRNTMTWVGGILIRDNPELKVWATADHLTVLTEKVTSQAWKFTHTVPSSVEENRHVSLECLPGSIVAGRKLPLVHGYGRVSWTDRVETRTTTATMAAPDLEHDLSWWVQHPDRITQLLDYLTPRVSTAHPRVTGVTIEADPRLELGDKIRIDDPHRLGLRVEFVITRIEQEWGAASPKMTLSGRVTSVTRPWPDFDQDRKVRTWVDLASAWQAIEEAA